MPDFFTSGGFAALLVALAFIGIGAYLFGRHMNRQKERELSPREREEIAVRRSREITRQV